MGALTMLQGDIADLSLTEKLSALSSTAANLSSSPADGATNDAFIKAAEELQDALRSAETNTASSSIRLALREIDLESLVGSNLLARVQRILDAKPFLVARAAQAFKELQQEFKRDAARLVQALNALQELGFEEETIDTHEYEVGILIPTALTHDDLRTINREMKDWLFVIDRLEELVRGQPAATVPVRSLSSGSFDLFLSVDPQGAMALLILAGGVYRIFQYVRDAAKRREEMEEAKYPEKYLKHIRQYEEELIEEGKKQILKKLLEHKSDALPENRIHELTSGLKKSIGFVLRSMNQGVDVEVSTPPEAEEEREEVEQEIKELQDQISTLRLEMTQIVHSLPDRSKPLLQLPDQTEPLSDADGAAAKAPKPSPSRTPRDKAG